jgi:hypothetical protein
MISPHEYARQRSAPANPLQGGLGRGGEYTVGGLSGPMRESRRTEGRSFVHQSAVTAAPGSRISARSISSGGLSTSGPAPEGGPPPEPQRIGPSGPIKLAKGVKGDFEKKSPHMYEIPRWGETFGKVVKNVAGASIASGSLTAQVLNAAVKRNPAGRLAQTAVGQFLGGKPKINLDEINPDFL